MTQLTLLAEMWSAVKESVISSDRAQVADNVVSLLVDHDISPEEIRRAFRSEGDIIDALKFHIDDDESWIEDEDEDEIDYTFDDHDDDDDIDENW
jgi:hypothetical protein